MKETDLFAPVKAWLEHGGHTVYSEVQPSRGPLSRADVLGLHGDVVTVVELKTSLTLDLMAQCVNWKPHAHLIYAAVPTRKVNPLAVDILSERGIGLALVDCVLGKVNIELRPKLNRKVTDWLRSGITEYHLTHSPEGGSAKGGHVTPYRVTMIRVREFLERMHDKYDHDRRRLHCEEGWVSIPDILDKCSTHYSTPKSSLGAALMSFESDWCETRLHNRRRQYRIKPELVTNKKAWWI